MLRAIIPALAAAALAVPTAGWAQSTDPSKTDTQKTEQIARDLPQQIHDKLVAEGFTDVKVVPGSYVVSGKDKDGNPIVMLIGPNGMTMMKGAKETAQHKDDDVIIQQ